MLINQKIEMIKFLILQLVCVLMIHFAQAQDKILPNNGDKISCKIIKIDSSQIHFQVYRSGQQIMTYMDKSNIIFYTHNKETTILNNELYTTQPQIKKRGGLLIGYNSSVINFKYDIGASTSRIGGLKLGWVSEELIFTNGYLLSGIIYSQTGGHASFELGNETLTEEYKIHDISLPISLIIDMEGVFLSIGGYVSMNVYGEVKTSNGIEDEIILRNNVEINNSNAGGSYLARTNYGLRLGLGYSVSKRLRLDILYKNGLRNLTPDVSGSNGYDPADFKKVMNEFSLNASFFLHLKTEE